ncbi:Kinesin-like protein [Lachnellula hyalina]|uniref:Kinesin-like protein n=1 Tax=Lachnellula hyalina TaxID=1316788 RepID=A0A8H8U3J1_9HELO|nr:Kinesin-like protein [Lachnellula hyalina]TVY29216.1 Kinesin-like protein [Lachnellula hyalina]
MPPAGGGNIKVVVRVRPFNGRELDRGAQCIVKMKGAQTILTSPADAEDKGRSGKGVKDSGQKVFAFDKSYWSFNKADPNYAGQDSLHEDLGKPLLDNAFQGYNNCIFAYGQTGSGKSYSMMGYGKEAGVTPMICQDMFERIGELQQDKNLRCTVEVSYLEIYNERVRDLLNPSTKGNLKVREHPSTGPYVEDLAKLVVSSFNEIEHLMDEGNKARTVAATNMNETSSRSHAVFTLTLTQKKLDVETNMSMEKAAKISLVDLAGSERANSTGATGARLKEGAEINRSLSTLGRVIAALADLSDPKAKKKGKGANQVPYRDSVLTWLLKDSLGGNSMTAMIAAISPADINFDETLSTLRYADSAKRIKNHAVVNEDANARMIRELKEELATLRSKLTGGGGGGGATEEVYAEGTPLEKQIVSIVTPDGTVKKVSKAEIAEQLNQSEKLYSDLNQTWEEKLQKTEEIHKERESALEELGISIEKGFVGLHTPKKMPHLVNLSDDPLLAECLVYNLKPGTTNVGNVDTNAAHTSEIRLNGSRILHEHCTFENVDNVVTIVPKQDAAVMVNGQRIDEPKRLRSGYRVILGDFHIFRFNHPMEARAERAESSLRHSIIASQIQDYDKISPSPSPRPGHERTISKATSDADWDSRPDSPAPFQRGRDSDWSFARREAASAILGTDQKIAGLTDEELNILFEDVQRARAERAGQNVDDDLDSVTSYPIREKYMSNGTLDNFSLDTALTMPSTPKQGEVEDKMREVREEMQVQLDKQKEEYQDQLKSAEVANVEVEEIKKEKSRMEESLREVKEEMLQQLEDQRKEFEDRLQQLTPSRSTMDGPASLSEAELTIARRVVEHWRGRRYVRMAEAILQSAANLKEAQIMSQEMEESVVFQFTIVDVGHYLCSSYDMVLNGISGDDDQFLESAPKPCVGVRVIDYRSSVVHLWSLEKLEDRVRLMRQMHQYMDRPEYLQHFRLDNPFMETCMPQYTHIGDVDVPLAAVFESRVQDFSLDVMSPYTSHAIGLIKLSLEPSSARAPSSTLKFNVVMHDMVGFAEREGSEVHAQLFLPGISEEGGVTTTQMIKDFDEGPIRFESVHSMSVPMFSPTSVALRVAIYAKVSSMHLDKLLSWDDMRDNVPRPQQKRKNARIAESQFYTEEKHDVFAKVQILELAETGEYLPVEVIQTNDLDKGSFQLHQGIQRRLVVNLMHSSGAAMPWQDVSGLRVGRIQLVDHVGKTPNLGSPSAEIPLKLISKPTVKANANGTSTVTLIGQWDSSAHSSVLLDRITADKYKVQMSVHWDVTSSKLAEPMSFSMEVCSQILSRSYVRSTSMFSSLWQTVRIVHSTSGIFSISVRPTPVKRAGDLWRMNTQNDYVKGEEGLTDWTPRGISLIRDHIAANRRRHRLAELEAAKPLLSQISFTPTLKTNDEVQIDEPAEPTELSEHQKSLLEKYTRFWHLCRDPITSILTSSNVEPPSNGVSTPPPPQPSSPTLLAKISLVTKNSEILKGGYLLTPSSDSSRWIRRFIELRKPYLHIHSVPDGEEVCIVALRNSRVDHQPQIAKLLKRADSGRGRAGERDEEKVFAVYGTDNTWLFKARSEREKVEWIFKIDQSYFGGGSSGGSGSASDE